MPKATVSIIMEQLASIIQTNKEVKLVVGVDDELQKLTSNFQAIQGVLDDAEGRQINDFAVRDWFDKLKNTSYDINDVLDEWKTLIGKFQIKVSKPMGKVCSLIPCYRICSRTVMHRDIALKIKSLSGKIVTIASEMKTLKFSSTQGSIELNKLHLLLTMYQTFMEKTMKDTLLKMLLDESSEEPKIPIISIVGMTGIGKNTHAQEVFNDNKVGKNFNKKIWVSVSSTFDVIRIAKAILKSFEVDVSESYQWSDLLREISFYIKYKKLLLVLDDVWSVDPKDWKQLNEYWKQLKRSLMHGSRILVTTSNKTVAESIGTTNMMLLGALSEEEIWSTCRQVAFSHRTNEECEDLENISRKIVSQCKSLPLSIMTLGSHLPLKTNIDEWQNVSDDKLLRVDKEVEKELFSPLLHYFVLPVMLKKCLLNCIIFPKDFEIEKDDLIKLWMAQGYIKEEQTKDMELIGEEYFETLAKYSFFNDFKKNEYDGRIESCKMHDMYDFAQFHSKNECFIQEIDDYEQARIEFSCERARHLFLWLKRGELYPWQIDNGENIRSLVVRCDYNMKRETLVKIFGDFTCLRSLGLRNCDLNVKKLPGEIKKLIHLRYLDLSRNLWLNELPEALCELYNLQTLNLNGCVALVKLPQGMGNLVNLRHLMNDCTNQSLSHLPKGIERLTCLRTLKEFIVGRRRLGAIAGIECLENLDNLQGSLDIFKLGNVVNVNEVRSANLKNKKNLLSLYLDFGGYDEKKRVNREWFDQEEVFKALEPPPSLETLGMNSYEGRTLSLNWMVTLTKLRMLTLNNFSKLEFLPSLGKLSSLESLHISWMPSVKIVDSQFLGVESDEISITVFYKLKTLRFSHMENWEKWVVRMRGDEDITIMPCLQSLSIRSCNKLKSLPDHLLQIPTLKQLVIDQCADLNNLYSKQTGNKWHMISHIPGIEIN